MSSLCKVCLFFPYRIHMGIAADDDLHHSGGKASNLVGALIVVCHGPVGVDMGAQ